MMFYVDDPTGLGRRRVQFGEMRTSIVQCTAQTAHLQVLHDLFDVGVDKGGVDLAIGCKWTGGLKEFSGLQSTVYSTSKTSDQEKYVCQVASDALKRTHCQMPNQTTSGDSRNDKRHVVLDL